MLKNFLSRVLPTARRRVGEDVKGNVYYETPVEGGRPKRICEPATGAMRDLVAHDLHGLPSAWASWLHHRRKDPPTPEELKAEVQRVATVQYMAQVRKQELAQLKLQLEEEEAKAALPPPITSTVAPSVEPSGSGEDFVPGTWGGKTA